MAPRYARKTRNFIEEASPESEGIFVSRIKSNGDVGHAHIRHSQPEDERRGPFKLGGV